ncbi:helix-turn-helix domain-containing protein [Calidifontibacter indicus]|uniref:helix-turn-helix domain-containing protein n=1 Tax=Calidifontibacter indicus TaxID=419650 RepID=UPI0014732B20|nr:helix-turn-helix domain-containing protein [Calidifontibacter indicus]
MRTISASSVTSADMAALDSMIDRLPAGSELRGAIESVAETVQSGRDLVIASEADLVSPAAAAKLVGVSRTHLYKLMDAGELPFVNVGRDRRVSLGDLKVFRDRQDRLRKQVAERFAHAGRTRAAARRSVTMRGRAQA